MDLLEVLGLSRPVVECALCLELYYDDLEGNGASALDALKRRCLELLQPHVESYVWQHEPLRLQSSLQQPPWVLKNKGKRHPHEQQAKQQDSDQQPSFLWGVVRYEDSVEDEWFVVWMLLHLTQQLPGLSARCWDDDGEFLLIEAAYALPRWLKPETASNRVWLRSGQLHIIPPPSAKAPTLPPAPSVSEALAVLCSGTVETRRTKVEACVKARVAGYPGQAQQQLQRTTAWLPRRLGLLLQADPQLVSAAVAAFMTRQRDEVAAASKLRLFPPTNMTTALVCLNRCMYAQLTQADFATPKGYPAPPSDNWLGGDLARQHKAVNMGLKIAVGMELMALRLGLQPQTPHTPPPAPAAATQAESDPQPAAAAAQQPQQQQQQGAAASLASNPAWHAYKAVLQCSGYFDGELEGSGRYRQLLEAAQTAFTSSEAYERSTAALAAPQQRLQELLQRVDAAAAAEDSQQQQQQRLSAVAAVLDVAGVDAAAAVDDGDEWMQVEADQLQQRLEQAELMATTHSSKKHHSKHQTNADTAAADTAADASSGAAVDAEQLLSGFRGFMQHMGTLEGADIPSAAAAGAAAGSGPTSTSSTSAKQQQTVRHKHSQSQQAPAAAAAGSAAGGPLNFDPESFLSELMGVLGAVADPLQQQQQQQNGHHHQQQQQQQDVTAAEALQQRLQFLQRQLEGFEAEGGHGGGGGGEDSDDYGSSGSGSSDEGSSFYGSDSDGGEEGDEPPGVQYELNGGEVERGGEPPELLQVPPPCSHKAAAAAAVQVDVQKQQQKQQQRQWAPDEAWEVMTATDSDDDGDALSLGGSSDEDGTASDEEEEDAASEGARANASSSRRAGDGAFYDSYTAALEAELAGTTMARTFEKVSLTPHGTEGMGNPAEDAAAASADGPRRSSAAAAAAGLGGSGLTPLDVDFNLIKSLVSSYTAQGGLPGPASNLAGLLGLQLPTEVEVQEEQEGE